MSITAHSLKCVISQLKDEFDSYTEDVKEKEELIEKFDAIKEKTKELVFRYGGIDGAHHKQWLMDQILRVVFSEDGYRDFLEEYNADCDPDGNAYYKWSEGIAP